jgi:quercetin dioxygenase-like cupin family protein
MTEPKHPAKPVSGPSGIFRFCPDNENFRWAGVGLTPYKATNAAPFKAISRQTLFSDPRLLAELRYFEIEPGGYSTLERHEHMHVVIVLRGGGQCLIGDEVHDLELNDLVVIEPWTWHQFRAPAAATLGFLCLVNAERDRPQAATQAERAALLASPASAPLPDER